MSQSETAEVPKLNLPAPMGETFSSQNNELASKTPEKTVLNPEVGERTNNTVISNPPAPQINIPTQLHLPDDISPVTAVASTSNVPDTADDNDLIEKEWVNKAKKIVKNNREDPFTQTKELTAFKADYMMKKYNKVIKVDE
jgi:hypothetical protein